MNLTECFDKYRGKTFDLDGTDKGTIHSYLELYEKILNNSRYHFKNVVEIGVKTGGSCASFSEYFVNATIYGIDIDLQNLKYGMNDKKIKYIQGDATNVNILQKLNLTEIDLVLDDGSHFPGEQIRAAEIFLPTISKNGFFICEDIDEKHSSYIKSKFTELSKKHNMVLDWYDLRHIKNRFDDIVAVIHY
jgi:cephalosporin hydroxylase